MPGAIAVRCRAEQTHKPSQNFLPNHEFTEVLKRWGKLTGNFFVYEYYALGGWSRTEILCPMVLGPKIFDKPTRASLRRFLDDAHKSVKSDLVRRRIAEIRRGFEECEKSILGI